MHDEWLLSFGACISGGPGAEWNNPARTWQQLPRPVYCLIRRSTMNQNALLEFTRVMSIFHLNFHPLWEVASAWRSALPLTLKALRQNAPWLPLTAALWGHGWKVYDSGFSAGRAHTLRPPTVLMKGRIAALCWKLQLTEFQALSYFWHFPFLLKMSGHYHGINIWGRVREELLSDH